MQYAALAGFRIAFAIAVESRGYATDNQRHYIKSFSAEYFMDREYYICKRKFGVWNTYAAAASAALEIFRRRRDLMTPYKCFYCKKYHIGHEGKKNAQR